MTQKSPDYLMMPGFTAEQSLYNTWVSQSLSAQRSFESTVVIPARWCPPGLRNERYISCVKVQCRSPIQASRLRCMDQCWNKFCDVEPTDF